MEFSRAESMPEHEEEERLSCERPSFERTTYDGSTLSRASSDATGSVISAHLGAAGECMLAWTSMHASHARLPACMHARVCT